MKLAWLIESELNGRIVYVAPPDGHGRITSFDANEAMHFETQESAEEYLSRGFLNTTNEHMPKWRVAEHGFG